MDLSELHSAPLPNAIPKLLKSKKLDCALQEAPYFSQRSYELALNQGGLPGIFAFRDAAIRRQRFETQIETLLERDLRLLVQTSLEYRTLRNLLVLQGSRRRPVIFLEDQGEATYLAGDRPDILFRMNRFLFSFIRQQWVYRPELEAQLFQYRSRGGAFVPLALHTKFGTLGFIPMLYETAGKHEMASARSFLSSYKNGKCIFVHHGKLDRTLGANLRIVPISFLV